MADPNLKRSACAPDGVARGGLSRRSRLLVGIAGAASLTLALLLGMRGFSQTSMREWAPSSPAPAAPVTPAAPARQTMEVQGASGPIRFTISDSTPAEGPSGNYLGSAPTYPNRAAASPDTGNQPAVNGLLTMTAGRSEVLQLRNAPTRVQITDPRVVAYRVNPQAPGEIALWGRIPGTAAVTFSFGNPADPAGSSEITYTVRVMSPTGSPELQPASETLPTAAPAAQGPQFAMPDARSVPSLSPVERAPLQPIPSWEPSQGAGPALAPAVAPPGPRLFDGPESYVQQRTAQPPATTQPRTAPTAPAEEMAPTPRRIGPRLETLDEHAPCPPPPSPEALRRYQRYIGPMLEPEYTMDLILRRPRLLELNEVPIRVQSGDETILNTRIISPREISLIGQNVGSTTLNIWFGEPDRPERQTILSFLVNVLPDPYVRQRLERVYKALEDELNRAFPDAYLCLFLVGDKLAVSGEVKDAYEATKILQIIIANVPGGGQQGATANPLASLPLTSAGITVGPDGAPISDLSNYILRGESNIINLLRIPGEQQVLLKVTVAEVSRSAARSMGINFNINNAAGQTVFGQQTGGLVTSGAAGTGTTATQVANLPLLLDNGRIPVLIQALRSVNLARSLAEPNLVTLNGHPATFLAGGEFPIPVVTGGTTQGLQGVNFVPFGVQLNFTPYVTDKDRIRLQLNATVSVRDVGTGATVGQTAGGAGTFVPGLNTRNISTTVEMREGQTLAVGGLMQTNLGGDTTRVPLLGDIPVGGQFFRVDHTSASESELVLLVTPELVHPMEPREIPPLPGSDYFEPDDINFYLRGKLENTRSIDYRSPVMHDWERMRAYRNCEILYMLGPVGHTDGH